MSAVSKTAQLQTLLQSQPDQLKSKRIGKLVFPHAVIVHDQPTTASPIYTLGNLCETIVNLGNFPNARIYLPVPPNHEGKTWSRFKEELSKLNEGLKMSAFSSGDILVQSGLGPALNQIQASNRLYAFAVNVGFIAKERKFPTMELQLLIWTIRRKILSTIVKIIDVVLL